jgi:hypothetical protein
MVSFQFGIHVTDLKDVLDQRVETQLNMHEGGPIVVITFPETLFTTEGQGNFEEWIQIFEVKLTSIMLTSGLLGYVVELKFS